MTTVSAPAGATPTPTPTPTFALAPFGDPDTAWLTFGDARDGYQTYEVVSDAPVLVTVSDGALVRIDRVHVNVDDPADINVVCLLQRARGGDYARRIGTWQSAAAIRECDTLAELRPILAAVETLLAPAPAPATLADAVDVLAARVEAARGAYERLRDMLHADGVREVSALTPAECTALYPAKARAHARWVEAQEALAAVMGLQAAAAAPRVHPYLKGLLTCCPHRRGPRAR